ncbi:MAG: PQQ-binding-like beta-propeller repeat protein [Planctomycetota bacterium]
MSRRVDLVAWILAIAALRTSLWIPLRCTLLVFFSQWMVALGDSVHAGESDGSWPTFRHDQHRSGRTQTHLKPKLLRLAWQWKSPLPPAPAWPDSARWDAYAKLSGLRSMRDYDPVFHPVATLDQVIVPSNADDTVRCFSMSDGDLIWSVTADGPIRVAPSIDTESGAVYFGSDDGCVYSVSLANGDVRWKRELQPGTGSFVNDGRLCSRQPVRTGVIIDREQDCVIAGCGIFPWKNAAVFALDRQTGEVSWHRDLGTGWTVEGAMLLSGEHLVAPQGRSPPQLFDRQTGKPAGALSGGGGSFVLLTDDDEILHGPGNKQGWITESDASSRQKVASFPGGSSVVVSEAVSYLLTPEGLSALDRDSQQTKWQVQFRRPQELVATADSLIVGGDGYVAALNATDGSLLWAEAVEGKAIGLAVATENLIASTDSGSLYVFSSESRTDTETSPKEPGNRGDTTTMPASVLERVGYGMERIEVEAPAAGIPVNPEVIAADDLLHHWYLFANHADQKSNVGASDLEGAQTPQTLVRSSRSNGLPLRLPRKSQFVQVGAEHALVLEEGVSATIASDYSKANLPEKEISFFATVRVDRTQAWGGLLSAMQDNGSYEKGWILGFRGNKFGCAINGQGGPDKLTWVTSPDPIQAGRWYDVVGTYDGESLKLYLNGELVASSGEQRGTIQYPNQSGFEFGAYKDADEYFPTQGRINEAGVCSRALGGDEVARRFRARQSQIGASWFAPRETATVETDPILENDATYEVAMGPELQFIEPGVAQVTWITESDVKCELELQGGLGISAQAAADSGVDGSHRWRIRGLGRNELVTFRINTGDGRKSRLFECDAHFDYTRPQRESLVTEAQNALSTEFWDQLPIRQERGFALVLGNSSGDELAAALGAASEFDVVEILPEEGLVEQRRQALLKHGGYGRPHTVLPMEQVSRFPRDFANLVVINADVGLLAEAVEMGAVALLRQITRAVKPGGYLLVRDRKGLGTIEAWLAANPRLERLEQGVRSGEQLFQLVRRRPAEGSSAWTHMYGNPDNTAFAGEALQDADSAEDLELTWCGRPGPRYQSDRGNRKPSPLAAGGRLYLQGLHRLLALDAHNGTILWNHELPELERFNVPRDCSNWCADEDHLFVAMRDRCRVIEGATGQTLVDHPVWNPTDREMEWGFVVRYDQLLIGSCVQAGSCFTGFWGGEHWYDCKDGEHAKKVCSDALFAQDPISGQNKWTYGGGLIVNPTIAVGDGRIVFAECRSTKLLAGKSRRLDGDEFWASLYLVALDVATGEKVWEQAAKPLPGVTAFYGVLADGQYLMQSSHGGEFALYSMRASDGKMHWRGKYAWEVDHHGKHLSRPAIMGNKLFLRPFTIDLSSGNVLAKQFPTGHQCGTYTASKNALFLRAGSLAMWDGKSTAATRWNRLRPDCWISTIPAEGMLLSPEGGGGCSCGGWIETSMAFAPAFDRGEGAR